MERAEKLTGALADESVRWQMVSERMTTALHSLVGDVFLAAAAISYLGAFTGGRLGGVGRVARRKRGPGLRLAFLLIEK